VLKIAYKEMVTRLDVFGVRLNEQIITDRLNNTTKIAVFIIKLEDQIKTLIQ